MPAIRLSKEKRALIIAALCEGSAINSVCRMFSTGKHAVLRIIEETAKACEDWHNRNFRDLTVQFLELDEQWAYVHTHRERMSKKQRNEHPDRGDCWLWASIDPISKCIINWRTGRRTALAAHAFAGDLATRVSGRVQITSDQLNSYLFAVPQVFGERVDYAQEHKIFRKSRVEGHEWLKQRVNPLVGVERAAITGKPDLRTSTVCHIERFFLTMRQGNKRCARKTLAYSKSWGNHALAASLTIFIYNMVRVHESLKTTPTVALGVAAKRWTLEQVVAMSDDYMKRMQDAEFESAFAMSMFTTQPTAARTYEPQKPKVPWYLDPESGGPNPAVKKPGIQYDDSQGMDEF